MALPLVEVELQKTMQLLEVSDPADADDALEHAIWLLAQLRSDDARRLELEPDGTLLFWSPGEVTLGSGETVEGEHAIPVEPAEWARTLIAQALA